MAGHRKNFVKLPANFSEQDVKPGKNCMNIWWRRGRQGALTLFLWVVVLGGCQNPFSPPPLVGIILWSQEIQSFEDNLRGVEEGLREEGYLDGLNVRLQVINTAKDRGRAAQAVEELQEQGVKLLLSLGTVPTLVAMDVTSGIRLPLVYSGVGAPAATGLVWQAAAKPRFTGTSIEVPVAEQLEMFRLALPRLSRLGILYCTASPVAVATGTAAGDAAREMGLFVVEATVIDERESILDKALTDLLDQGVEALFLPTDPVLASPKNLKIIGERMLPARIPVMVPFESSVIYGALLSYHADFAEVGRQAGRQAARILSGVAPSQVPPECPKVKRLTLNLKVAQDLGLPLSRHLLSQAHELY
jgi:putative tryptophan/tyrosine transport system substrate-binding protein